MPIGTDKMSLTRNTTLQSLTNTAAQLTEGMTPQEVAAVARRNNAENASSWIRNLFAFKNNKLVTDEWLRAARSGDTETATALSWAARVWSEPRLAAIVEKVLTDKEGHFIPESFSTDFITQEFEDLDVGDNSRKAATSLLNQAAAVPLFNPLYHAKTIVGVDSFLPVTDVVPSVVTFISERVSLQINESVAQRGEPIDISLLWKANRWFGLSRTEFTRAALPAKTSDVARRSDLPASLTTLHQEARRRKQVVLQGSPGTGKTHVALQYIDWATSNKKDESNLSSIVASLPAPQRTPKYIADEIKSRGLSAVWDIAQFHPSYGYEDFVRTLSPKPTPHGVTFEAEHRILSLIASVALELKNGGSKCETILIVDELNRADIARVFGELLFALEYRDAPVRTPYSVDGDYSMTIPSNLIMIGTINTADRSIALIDYALRRRFTFITLSPSRDVVARAKWVGQQDKTAALDLFDKVSSLFTADDDNTELAVGHSYFLPSGDYRSESESVNALAHRFAYEVIPLLNEYAAEGTVDVANLATMLSEVGITDGDSGADRLTDKIVTYIYTMGSTANE